MHGKAILKRFGLHPNVGVEMREFGCFNYI